MPSIRIVSWNSTGENVAKAAALAAIQPALAGLYPLNPNVDVYLIQEAWQGGGGAIDAWLNGLAGYTVTHIAEQPNGGGRGYICATRNAAFLVSAPGVSDFQLWNYGVDPDYVAWVPPAGYNALAVAGAGSRPPAFVVLTEVVTGDQVLLTTWHAPLGIANMPGYLIGAMPGGGLLDAFMGFDASMLLQNPDVAVGLLTGAPGPVMPSVTIVAGDLNANGVALAAVYPPFPSPAPYRPLNNFQGLSNNLDHILAEALPGGPVVNVIEGHNTPSPSVHNILSARITW